MSINIVYSLSCSIHSIDYANAHYHYLTHYAVPIYELHSLKKIVVIKVFYALLLVDADFNIFCQYCSVQQVNRRATKYKNRVNGRKDHEKLSTLKLNNALYFMYVCIIQFNLYVY